MERGTSRVKYLPVKYSTPYNILKYPNFPKTGSVTGMRKLYYGKDALLVRCGEYIYNVTSNPEIYKKAH